MTLELEKHLSTPAEATLSRQFAAPRDLVFRVWTDPKFVSLWWGVNGARNVVRHMDVRPGGRWSIEMIVASGTKYPNGGEFLEVVENERLVYSDVPALESPAWDGSPPKPTINTVRFETIGESTLVRLSVQFQSHSDMARMVKTGFETGLGQSMDRLARLLASICENEGRDR